MLINTSAFAHISHLPAKVFIICSFAHRQASFCSSLDASERQIVRLSLSNGNMSFNYSIVLRVLAMVVTRRAVYILLIVLKDSHTARNHLITATHMCDIMISMTLLLEDEEMSTENGIAQFLTIQTWFCDVSTDFFYDTFNFSLLCLQWKKLKFRPSPLFSPPPPLLSLLVASMLTT